MRVVQIALILLAALYAQATSLQIQPTTTLAAETGNNTSAASTWKTSKTGDVGAGNVSKVDHHTLLYPGATTQIYTNIMFWFGPQQPHAQTGYNSNDFNQVKRQVDDHLSRGLTGTIVDWYGTGHSFDNNATLYLKQYAESLPGYPFKFAIMEDKGALLNAGNVTAQLVSDLTYVVQTYGGSPAYMKFNNQPVIFFFGLERFNIDWNFVKAHVPGNPLFIFENPSGFSQTATSGAYSWVMINTGNSSDWMQSYLSTFYDTAVKNPAQHTFGATWKGFNDGLASWSLNRVMNQQCGQVWLNTWNEVGKHYSSTNQLESMQIVTWNDYEEGSEIETGIDNCVTINAGISGQTLNWSITGNENTLDHYTAFISEDGQNLMALADVGAGIHSLDLSQFGLGSGNYTVYVKAVGKPSFLNHMSAAVPVTVTGGPVATSGPASSPGIGLTASPAAATIKIGESATFSINVAGSTKPVTLSCEGLPAGANCSFSPQVVQPGTTTASVLTISTGTVAASLKPLRRGGNGMLALGLPFFGMFLLPARIRNRARLILQLAVLIGAMLLLAGCGGGSNSGAGNVGSGSSPAIGGTPAGTYTITINGQANSKLSTTVSLTVK